MRVPESVDCRSRRQGRARGSHLRRVDQQSRAQRDDIGEYRTFFKLYPPLRREDDRTALAARPAAGEIDIIVSAHDPQDVDTKRLPSPRLPMARSALKPCLPPRLRLHHDGSVPLMRLIDAMSTAPGADLRPDQAEGLAGVRWPT